MPCTSRWRRQSPKSDTSVGTHAVSAAATDKAGNSNSASAAYTVEMCTLQGAFASVEMGIMNRVNSGSAMPLKFRVLPGQTEFTDIGLAGAGSAGSSLN